MAEILNVCTANRCRSPLAEMFLRAALGGAAVSVSSAGTWTRGGEPMWPAAAQEAVDRGVPPGTFTSRPITPELIASADVILAATRALRDEVVTQVPAALRKTFTWRELAWLVDGLSPADVPGSTPAERVEALPVLVAGRRGHLVPPPGEALDVDDPVGKPPDALAPAADLILSAILTIAGVLVPPPVGRHRGRVSH